MATFSVDRPVDNSADAPEVEADTWLERATSAWGISDQYWTNNIESQLVKNQCLFDSKHPPGSKYLTESYKWRSRLFRPKVRSSIRKTEAAGVQAFFSTIDAIEIAAEDDTIDKNRIAAALVDGDLKHHLNNTMHWFLTCIGGLQDAQKHGVVCSYNHWLKKTARYTVEVPEYDDNGAVLLDEGGKPVFRTEQREDVLEDRPNVELFPFNYLRFHPAAQWIDPMNTSPFVCRIRPLYVYEIKRRMEEDAPQHERWTKLTDDEIKTAKMSRDSDAAQNAADKGKESPLELQTPGVGDYDMSIVLQWFMISPEDGRRYTFHTLGTRYRLDKPKLLKRDFPHGKVPITMGYYILEAHRSVPTGVPELAQELQKEANDIVNSRLDNVKLALNKRYIVRRGSQTDIKSLLLNAAGSVTMASNVDDVKEMAFTDVTGSSYAEQDRLSLDSDELLGNFSQSSVQSNRKLNETVGGMAMLNSSAGQITDYGLRTFAETWMEPTLRQIVSLLQYYETDQNLLEMVSNRKNLAADYGDESEEGNRFDVKPEMLEGNVRLTVNVGVGASNPMLKAQQFIMAIKQLTETLVALKGAQVTDVQVEEIAKELFGYIGYKDGSRFFKLDKDGQINPQMQELQQALEEATRKLDAHELENEGKKALKQMELAQKTASERKQREHDWNVEQLKSKTELRKALISANTQKIEAKKKAKAAEAA